MGGCAVLGVKLLMVIVASVMSIIVGMMVRYVMIRFRVFVAVFLSLRVL